MGNAFRSRKKVRRSRVLAFPPFRESLSARRPHDTIIIRNTYVYIQLGLMQFVKNTIIFIYSHKTIRVLSSAYTSYL